MGRVQHRPSDRTSHQAHGPGLRVRPLPSPGPRAQSSVGCTVTRASRLSSAAARSGRSVRIRATAAAPSGVRWASHSLSTTRLAVPAAGRDGCARGPCVGHAGSPGFGCLGALPSTGMSSGHTGRARVRDETPGMRRICATRTGASAVSEQLPPDPFTDPRRAAAYHEGVNAEIGLHLGFDLIGIELRDDPDSTAPGPPCSRATGRPRRTGRGPLRRPSPSRRRAWALMGWVGTLAAELSGADVAASRAASGSPRSAQPRHRARQRPRPAVGFADAIAIAIGPGEVDAWLEWTCSRCLGLVQQMWPVIERVAARLLEAGQLSGEQVRAEWQRCRRALP